MILTLRVSEAQKSYFIYFLAVCHEKKKKNEERKEIIRFSKFKFKLRYCVDFSVLHRAPWA